MLIKSKTKIWLHTITIIALICIAQIGLANHRTQDQTDVVKFAGINNITNSPFYKDLHIKDPDTRGALSAAWLYSMWLQHQPANDQGQVDNRDWLKETIELFSSPATYPAEKARLVSQLQNLKQHYWNLEKVSTNTITGITGSVTKEYSLAGNFNQEQLVALLKTDNFIQENRLILIFSEDNIAALFKHGENYYFFNPNPNIAKETRANSIEELAITIFYANLLDDPNSNLEGYQIDPYVLLGFQMFSFDQTAAEYPDQQVVLDNTGSTLSQNSGLNSNSTDNKNALAMSARIGCDKSLAYFLETVDNPNFLDYEGSTPLIQAIEKNHCSLIKTMFENGANPNFAQDLHPTPLLTAIKNKDYHCVELLLQKGANPNLGTGSGMIPTATGFRFAMGTTPLEAASHRNNPKIIKILLKYDADPSYTHNNLSSPFTAAADCPECLQILLDKGVDPNQTDGFGYNALLIAASLGNHESIKTILSEKKVDPNCRTSDGSIPLTILNNAAALKKDILEGGDLKKSAENKQTTCIKELIKAGANPNLKDEEKGWTPLMYAAQNGFLASMTTLLDQGADPKIKAWKYKIIPYRAIDIAKKQGHQDCVDLLKQFEQDTPLPPAKNITRYEL